MPTATYLLALDVLESVRLLPGSATLWQRLTALVSPLETDERLDVLSRVTALPLGCKEGEWFRASAMASLTRDSQWYVRQAELADAGSAPDAVMQLLGLAWHHALVDLKGHQAFVQFMGDFGLLRLQRQLADALPVRGGARNAAKSRLRVAVYTPQVIGDQHGGTTFALNVASLLLGLAVDFCVFAAQEVTIPESGAYVGGEEMLIQAEVRYDSLRARRAGHFELIVPNTAFSLRTRLNQVIGAIHAYQPDVVIFVGLMSPLLYRLYADYPVVALSIHAFQPAVPADVWLASEVGATLAWPDLPPPAIVEFPFRFWSCGKAMPVDRTMAGVPDSAVVLITVGYRLAREIDAAWSDRMRALLERHPDVYWLLIGQPEGAALAPALLHPRIRAMPPQSLLGGWLAMSDIYANPPRLGGGGSVVMAMEQARPVAAFCGTDGGEKLGTLAAATADDYFRQLETWISDPLSRQAAGMSCAERFASRLDASSDEAKTQLTSACQRALASFSFRSEAHNA